MTSHPGKGQLQRFLPEILRSGYYWEIVDYLQKVLSDSRLPEIFCLPAELYSLQDGMVAILTDLENAIGEGKRLKEAAADAGDSAKEQEYELGIVRNKALVYVTQSVADGLAWRLLGFDRPFIRVMSAPKKYRGSVDFPTAYPGMEDAAIKLMYENGSRIFFNDISRYLRLGDLTEFLPDGRVIIHELKKNGSTVKNACAIANQNPKAGISRQMRNIVVAQGAFDERKIKTQTQMVEIENIDLPFDNNLAGVKELIAEARETRFARKIFGNYLEVQCLDYRATVAHSLHQEKESWKQFDTKHRFSSADVVASVFSSDAWFEGGGDFTRNKTPYAIYPFDVADCMGLISGDLRLTGVVNLSEIHRMFGANGWRTSALDIGRMSEEWERSKSERPPDETFNYSQSMTAFTINRNGFNLGVPFNHLMRVGEDFMKPEVLLATAEYVYATADRGVPETLVEFITGEKSVWV